MTGYRAGTSLDLDNGTYLPPQQARPRDLNGLSIEFPRSTAGVA